MGSRSSCAAGRLPAYSSADESERAGSAHGAARWCPEALRAPRRGDRGDRSRQGWIDGDLGHGTASGSPIRRPRLELYFETEKYEPPDHLRPALKNHRQRYLGRGAAVKRLDHVNVLALDVAANRAFAEDVLGFRRTSGSSSTTAPRPARG